MIGKLVGIGFVLITLMLWRNDQTSQAAETDTNFVYLPLVVKNYPVPLTIFGVEINRGKVLSTVDFAKNAQMTWVRYNGIVWHEVEPVSVASPDGYDWSRLSTFESEILALRERGIEPMVVIRGTPTWARYPEYIDFSCSPMRYDTFDDFAEFVSDMVTKYSKAPYYIRYWELGNEPDVHPELLVDLLNSPFGCWGDYDDKLYYGGRWYADMLKAIYPAIKQVDPSAKVILGGLLLACDPSVPGNDQKCLASKYLEGILQAGGGNYLDIIAYHAYPYWYQSATVRDWDLTQDNWAHRGGTLIGKLAFVREVMARYNIDKPILMNEGGLMCGYSWDPNEGLCGTDEYEQAKSNFVVRMYARTGAIGIMGSTWYTLNGPGWRTGGLLSDTTPLPSYNVYHFLANKVGDAKYLGQLSAGDLEGYQFQNTKTGNTYRIYWSNSSATYNIQKPGNTLAVYDRYGNVLTTGTQLSIGFNPIIIEIGP